MAELSDVQNAENEQVSSEVVGAEIPQPEVQETPEKFEKPDKPLSLRDQIKSATETVRKEEERARDAATGKFVAKDKVEQPKAAPKETPAPKQDAPPETPKVVGPPPGWSPEGKAYFDALPADHPFRRDNAKREEEIANGFKKYAEREKRYQEVEQVLAPVRQSYQRHGIQSDAEAIRRLFTWEAYVRNNPAKAISELAQQYGVNLSSAQSSAQPPAAVQEVPAQSPEFGQLSQKVQSLENQLQQSEQQQVSKELAVFAAKDHPHFEKVRVSMGRLMQSGMATDLDSAYQQAVLLDPDLRKQAAEEAETKHKAELAKAAAQTQTAQKLRAAVSPPSRAPTPPPALQGAKGQKGVRGAILQSIAELNEERA